MAKKTIKKRYEKAKKAYRELRGKIKKGLLRKKKYISYLEKCPIQEKAILLESQHGGTVGAFNLLETRNY